MRYLQLVHNEWDPAAKSAKMRVLHNFGREDQLDKAAIERLAGSLCRLLEPCGVPKIVSLAVTWAFRQLARIR